MRFINSKFHSVIDYASGVFLLCLPKLTGGTEQESVKWLAFLVGIVILLQAILTNYEGGIARIIPLYIHLIVDVILGMGLLVIPWLIDINRTPKNIFLIMGVLAIIFGLFTRLKHSARYKIYNHFK